MWTLRLKSISTPADPKVRLKKDDGVSKAVNPVLYQSMVGSLLYAGIATRLKLLELFLSLVLNPQKLTLLLLNKFSAI